MVFTSPAPGNQQSHAWHAWLLPLLLVGWCVLCLIVGVEGDYPLNDDWAYAIPVRTFLETGEIVPLEWTWTPLITQVLIGAAGAKVLGYSHESLRIVTLVFGAIAIAATYGLSRRLSASPLRAAGLAVLLLVNPVFVNLAFTFMLDVPFTALLLLSLYGVVSSIELSERGIMYRATWFGFGAAMMFFATLSRQTGLAVAVAVGAALVLTGLMRRSVTRRAAFALTVAVLSLPLLYFLMTTFVRVADIRRIAALEFLLWQFTRPHVPYTIITSLISVLSYLGMFLSPLVLLRVLSGHVSRLTWALALPASVLGLLATRYFRLPMPPGYNVLYNFGLGPLTLVGELSDVLKVSEVPLWGLHAACLFSAILAALLLLEDVVQSPRFRRNMSYPILLLFPIIYIAPQLARIPFFDRYLLPTVPPLALGLLMLARKPFKLGTQRCALPAGLATLMLAYGVVGTRDYMRFMGKIHTLSHGLQQQGVPTEFIDAGFEHWGLHGFAEGQVPGDPYDLKRLATRPIVLSFHTELPDYQKVGQATVWSTLLQREIPIYTHERLQRPNPPTVLIRPL